MDSNDITRRRVIGTLGAAGAIGLAGCGGGGSTDDENNVDEVRIGMIQPLSGSLQAYGAIAMRGFYTYFGYRGADIPDEISEGEQEFEVEDTTYVIDVRDSGGDQTEAQDAAAEMAEDVTALAGATSSSSALAIANNVANEQGVPYMVGPAASVEITGDSDNCSEAVFRGSETVAMDAQSGGLYIAEETDIDSVYIYYADYSFGESVNENYTRVLENNGVSVAGNQALPPAYDDDWPAQFDQAVNANVDAVIGGFTVATLPAMLGTYLANDYDFRFVGGWGTVFSAQGIGVALSQTLGENYTAQDIKDAGLGPLTTRYHWNQYDNDIASEANDIHVENYGSNTDLFTSGMFTNASALVQAVEQAGSADPSDIVGELTGMSVDVTLKGEGGYEFQEYNNQARSAMTVADPVPTTADNWDAPIQPGEPLKTYGMDETTLPESETDCSLN